MGPWSTSMTSLPFNHARVDVGADQKTPVRTVGARSRRRREVHHRTRRREDGARFADVQVTSSSSASWVSKDSTVGALW